MDYENLENIFNSVDNEERFKEMIRELVNEQDAKGMILFFELYCHARSSWNYLKIKDSKDTLNIIDKKTINEIIKEINENEGKFSNIYIKLENKDYDDINLLDSYASKYRMCIEYGEPLMDVCSLEEFKNMRETINYYKRLIDSSNLSSLEIITYAYDLIKSQKFMESENDTDRTTSRCIHSIIKNGNIVCHGYSKFLSQLLSEYGIESYVAHIATDSNAADHSRLILKVNDKKYDVNGLFAFDASFDSAFDISLCKTEDGTYTFRNKKNPIKNTDKKIKEYDNTCLYKSFLVPLDQWATVFCDKIESFDEDSKPSNESKIIDLTNHQHNEITEKGMDLKLFIKLMYNVKLVEGFDETNITSYIDDLIVVNGFSNKIEVELIDRVIKDIKGSNNKTI